MSEQLASGNVPRPAGALIGLVVVSYGLMFSVLLVAVALVAWLTGVEPVPVPLLIAVAVVGTVAFSLAAMLPTIWMLRAGVDAADGRPITFGRMVDLAGLGTAFVAAAWSWPGCWPAMSC